MLPNTMEGSMLERIQPTSEAVARPSNESQSKPKDVFDQENFDATMYINEMFPTGRRTPISAVPPIYENGMLKMHNLRSGWNQQWS
jgi:hypothetical protein